MPAKQILIVEGVADQYLFEEIFRHLGVSAEVRVTSPRDHGGKYNTKGGVFNTLPLLIRQLNDGRLDRVAVVVDADHKINSGMGFTETLRKLTDEILIPEGYTNRTRVGQGGGYCFNHNDGLNAIGVWIMPDNSSEGGVEEWALGSAVNSELLALQYADNILLAVPGGIKFGPFHRPKAQAAAWMSWQVVPGQGLHQAVRENLIDFTKPVSASLVSWIRQIFP